MIDKITKSYDALLIDLDGTLLDIDFEKFLFAYIDALSRRFVDYINPDDFATHLFGATTLMIENEDPSKINLSAITGAVWKIWPGLLKTYSVNNN